MAVSITDELSSMLKNSEFPLYERAVMFAAAAHSGMTRKGVEFPICLIQWKPQQLWRR